jgi:Polyketide cyclase / dehydrase and lipid transport
MFTLTNQNIDFLTTAPWIFQSEMIIDLPVSDVWKILNNDDAWQYWNPEVAKIQWQDGNRGRNSERTVTYKDPLFMVLLLGPSKLYEVFDEYEHEKKLGFYLKGLNRPNFLTYKSFREQFELEAVSDKQCKLTRIVAAHPGFLTRYALGCVIYPHLQHFLTKKCPERMLKSIAEGKLPRPEP